MVSIKSLPLNIGPDIDLVCPTSSFFINIVGSSLGIPQGDVHKILIYHKQQIFSYRIEEPVSLKSLPLNIGPDIDLVCPTSSFFINIVIDSSWMGAIWRPCSIQAGRAKLLLATLCACRLFWHPALTKLQC